MVSDRPDWSSPWPPRYRLLSRLGSGGGGQVWAALDVLTQQNVALKGLHEGASGHEAEALIREITALSGLEGLGFPRVLSVGLGSDGRPYLVRELVQGRSLEKTIAADPKCALELLPRVADALTVVHRAGLLHGDVKPGNVLEREVGAGIALVDLGLSTVLREGGVFARGLTPRYAAPEVRRGNPLTVQAEVYSLGVILSEIVARLGSESAELREVVRVATHSQLDQRYPSADEFATALRQALGEFRKPEPEMVPWPVLGIDGVLAELRRVLSSAKPGTVVTLLGPEGSGRTTLLRRLGWELALGSLHAVVLDAETLTRSALGDATRAELLVGLVRKAEASEGILLLDADARELPELLGPLAAVLHAGGQIVQVAASRGAGEVLGSREVAVELPELEAQSVRRLLKGALPTLPQALFPEVVRRVSGRPGALRHFVQLARGRALASAADVEEVCAFAGSGCESSVEGGLDGAERALDRGRYGQAKELLLALDPQDPHVAWLLARHENVAGSATRAVELCESALRAPGLGADMFAALRVTLGRARLAQSRWDEALECFRDVESYAPRFRAEGLAYRGLVQSLSGQSEQAEKTLAAAAQLVPEVGARLGSIVWSCLAAVEWRSGRGEEAAGAYSRAISAASEAGDAGALASAQINLAGVRKVQGDLAASVELLEAAIEAATASGRTASVQQALLNLANLDVYLGRLERARASLLRLDQLGSPSQQQKAQILGLHADIASRLAKVREALAFYDECERAWTEQNRSAEAAEAVLEGLLAMLGHVHEAAGARDTFQPTGPVVDAALERGRALLSPKETPLLRLAEARVWSFRGEGERAETRAAEAKELALETGQREWAWRALALEAELLEDAGRHTKARRARLEATEILEEIGARLPSDLREVYWNDPRRSAVREEATEYVAPRSTRGSGKDAASSSHLSGSDVISRMSQTPLERRLAKILAINSDLASEMSFEVLSAKILLHATELLGAERGYLLLGDTPEKLAVVASRCPQGAPHREFSRSIAAEVLQNRAPFFSIDAGADQRLARFESVHLASMSAVACVPILSPAREPLGAIYIETKARVEQSFGDEMPTLQAFAEQAAIALGWLRLVRELSDGKAQLQEKNAHLLEAQRALKDSLRERTEHLHDAKKKLHDTQVELERSTSYAGLVGASAAMRKVYALIDRVRATDVSVLITGESGTGKEVLARAIHEGSPRKKGKMLAVNCGAIPENLLESELFGHVRGAFTGADRERRGLFQEAKGGTLLLDEIGEMPLKMQAGLLRVLQEAKVRPVGSNEEVATDVRVLFATNRDLSQAVSDGNFREDLLYRIQVVELALPALRDRREDIPLLIEHFLARCAVRFGGTKRTMSRDAILALMQHDWPGNVRQLENTITNAWVLAEGEQITADDLNLPVRGSVRPKVARDASERRPAPVVVKKGTLSEHDREERGRIVEALDKTGWNRARAAEVLGMPRRTLYRRLREYGLQ